MTHDEGQSRHLGPGLSGALRTFAFWIANGTVGLPLLEGLDYWADMRESPSLMEGAFAVFANVLRLDADGNPVNAKEAEQRAAMFIRQWSSSNTLPAEPPLEHWEVALY
jgi:hypothetical protein